MPAVAPKMKRSTVRRRSFSQSTPRAAVLIRGLHYGRVRSATTSRPGTLPAAPDGGHQFEGYRWGLHPGTVKASLRRRHPGRTLRRAMAKSILRASPVAIAILICVASIVLASCATPVVTLKNEATGQVARCGGGVTGSIAGGLIGHNIEIASDENCVRDYESRGFIREGRSIGSGPAPTRATPTSAAVTPGAAPSAVPVAADEKAAPKSAAPVKDVRDAHTAERFAKDAGCADKRATLVGRGPGYESFSFECTNGDTLIVQCEMGNCRALK